MGNAVVVGASSDIGAAVVRTLSAAGYDCLGWGRDPTRLAGTVFPILCACRADIG